MSIAVDLGFTVGFVVDFVVGFAADLDFAVDFSVGFAADLGFSVGFVAVASGYGLCRSPFHLTVSLGFAVDSSSDVLLHQEPVLLI